METQTQIKLVDEAPAATQESFKVGEYVLPGFAYDANGGITPASMVDVMMTFFALMENQPKVHEAMKALQIAIRDNSGRIVFPKA